MAVSFIVLILSSVVLYILPAGRVAYWTDWHLWGLNKDQWGSMHTVGGFAFILLGIVHLIYNWKLFLNYLVSKIHRTMDRKMEIAICLILNAAILVLCIQNWPPASTIMAWGNAFKVSWEKGIQQPPLPHAELLKLGDLLRRQSIDLHRALTLLAEKGVDATPDEMVGEIARRNEMTPAELFSLIAPLTPLPPDGIDPLPEGGGWGKKTVEQACNELEVPLDTGLQRLHAAGIEASAEDNLRALAEKRSRTPIEVAEMLRRD